MQHSFSDFYDAEVHSLLLVFFCVAFSSSEGLNRLGTFHWPSLQHWSSYLAAKDLLALTPLHLLATDLGLVDHKDSDSHCITWSHWCRIASYFFCQIFFRWLIASRRNLKPRAKDIFATKLQSFAFVRRNFSFFRSAKIFKSDKWTSRTDFRFLYLFWSKENR